MSLKPAQLGTDDVDAKQIRDLLGPLHLTLLGLGLGLFGRLDLKVGFFFFY